MPRGGSRIGAGRPKGQGKFGEKTKPIRVPISKVNSIMNFINNNSLSLPLYSSKVPAGFPSPADDHMEEKLDLNTHLVKHPTATFFVKASGDSMVGAGIHDGDILVVDRSLEPRQGRVVIAAIDGQLTVKRLKIKGPKTFLVPENKKFRSIELNENNDVKIWGVVTSVIHKV
ncbi:MAG: DNA polymerase V [Rhodobiaceae bacterium]|nr:DNA polymerase V [Rhodobiaceae bacterium]